MSSTLSQLAVQSLKVAIPQSTHQVGLVDDDAVGVRHLLHRLVDGVVVAGLADLLGDGVGGWELARVSVLV
jgi:hypothetical protein